MVNFVFTNSYRSTEALRASLSPVGKIYFTKTRGGEGIAIVSEPLKNPHFFVKNAKGWQEVKNHDSPKEFKNIDDPEKYLKAFSFAISYFSNGDCKVSVVGYLLGGMLRSTESEEEGNSEKAVLLPEQNLRRLIQAAKKSNKQMAQVAKDIDLILIPAIKKLEIKSVPNSTSIKLMKGGGITLAGGVVLGGIGAGIGVGAAGSGAAAGAAVGAAATGPFAIVGAVIGGVIGLLVGGAIGYSKLKKDEHIRIKSEGFKESLEEVAKKFLLVQDAYQQNKTNDYEQYSKELLQFLIDKNFISNPHPKQLNFIDLTFKELETCIGNNKEMVYNLKAAILYVLSNLNARLRNTTQLINLIDGLIGGTEAKFLDRNYRDYLRLAAGRLSIFCDDQGASANDYFAQVDNESPLFEEAQKLIQLLENLKETDDKPSTHYARGDTPASARTFREEVDSDDD